MCGVAQGAWVLRRRDLRRGTEPQMSLKQFLSNIQSGTERFYTLSASLVHRLSMLSAEARRAIGSTNSTDFANLKLQKRITWLALVLVPPRTPCL